ncbi:hypothetical protein Kisp02_58450 [Kineosporia sp. NBRC 101731]|nr:hypothetical protein Kisp02_58450 [Kineosporia sp. NBRC 101731]
MGFETMGLGTRGTVLGPLRPRDHRRVVYTWYIRYRMYQVYTTQTVRLRVCQSVL